MYVVHITYTDHGVTIHHFGEGAEPQNKAAALALYSAMLPSRQNDVAAIQVYVRIYEQVAA